MSPETVQKLREQTPELKELIAYLRNKANELNTLDGIDKLPFGDRAPEASVRIAVHNALLDILAPLLNDNSGLTPLDPSEYVV